MSYITNLLYIFYILNIYLYNLDYKLYLTFSNFKFSKLFCSEKLYNFKCYYQRLYNLKKISRW